MSKHSARGTGWERQRKRVLDRDAYTCTYCHKHLEGSDATVDHIESIANAVDRDYLDEELTSSCRSCNGRKGDRALVRVTWHNPRWF